MEKTLPEVCIIQYGFPFDSSKFCSAEGVPLVRIRDVVRGYSETYTTEIAGENYIVNDGDLLIGMDGEFNIAYWKGGRAYLNQRVCRLIPREDVDRDYIFYYMPQALKAIEDATPFVTVKHLSAKQLSKILIPLPDMSEQQRISAVLRSVDRVIAMRKKELDEINNLVKSRFIELFGDQTANPYAWQQTSIGACCTLKSGTSLPADRENEGGAIPYVKVGDMNYPGNEQYITTSSRFVSEQTAGTGVFPVGTVVFPKRGGAIGTNKKRLTRIPICADLNVMGVTAGRRLTPQYLMAYFNTVDLGTLNNGSSVPQINNKDIAPLLICIPPMALQEQFAAFVEQTDKSKLAVQKGLQELEILKKSLMQQYFG